MTDAGELLVPTAVSFPEGGVAGRGRVQWTGRHADGRGLVVVDRTPFHPIDHTWPDQPSDLGTLSVGGQEHRVAEALTGAFEIPGGPLRIGHEIPVRRDSEGWTFVVVHVLEGADSSLPQVGEDVGIHVDAEFRAGLSAGHTACHLIALALNKSLASLWSKTPRVDGLGQPDFDQAAITESRIGPFRSVDRYRLGKSLRKSGFATARLVEEVGGIQADVNAQVSSWIAADARIRIEAEAADLTARRWWSCALPEGTARLACGGTHVESTGALGRVRVELDLSEAELVVRTEVGDRA